MRIKSTSVVALSLLAFSAWSAEIKVQPIQVCDDAGANCAAISTFSDYATKIYAQRGDTVTFLSPRTFNSSTYLTLRTNRNQ